MRKPSRVHRFLFASSSLLLVVSAACSVEEPAGPARCMVKTAGATNIATECRGGEGGADRVARAETFRSHAAAASSGLALVLRGAGGIFGAFVTCVAQGIVDNPVLADSIPLTCDYPAKAGYTFHEGTYTFDLVSKIPVGDSKQPATEHTGTARLFFTKAVAGHQPGELVTLDLADPATLLVNARLVRQGSGYAIAFDGVGPLVELLGRGASPQNPLPVTQQLQDDVAQAMGDALAIEGATHGVFADCTERSTLDLTIPRTPLSEDVKPTLDKGEMVDTSSGALVIGVSSWALSYALRNLAEPSGKVVAKLGPGSVTGLLTVTYDPSVLGGYDLDMTCGAP